ncbi:MAG: signal peptidase II [bacterium]|nr:signal peptidase II [bacterium]
MEQSMTTRYQSAHLLVLSLTGIFAIDRLLKILASHIIEKEFIFQWLMFGRYENPGIGFGWELPALLVVPLVGAVVVALSLWWLKLWRRHERAIVLWGVGLILIGALNNYIDRVYFGYVVDYFNFNGTGVWNISDCNIIVGGLLVLRWWRRQGN